MMVFGKKCPSCGGKQLTTRPSASRIAALPTAKAFSCSCCRQPLVYWCLLSIGIENRQYARKKMPPFFVVRIAGRADKYARIKNISEGGLCFNHHYNAGPLNSRLLMVDLYNCNEGSSLEQLPAKIVATSEQLLDINGIKTTVLNYCAQFVNLNHAQRKVLHTCLAQYGMS